MIWYCSKKDSRLRQTETEGYVTLICLLIWHCSKKDSRLRQTETKGYVTLICLLLWFDIVVRKTQGCDRLRLKAVSHWAVCYCSKKDSRLRQTELLSHISPAVTSWLSKNCQQLMSDHQKHSLILSIITHCSSMLSLSYLLSLSKI